VAKFRFTPQSVGNVQRKLKAATELLQRKAVYALATWADDTVGEIKAELLRVKAFDTGMLMGSVTRSAPFIVGNSKVRVVVFTPLEYAVIVEFGRRPGGKAPPLSAICGWARRKGLVRSLPVNLSFDGPLKKKLFSAYAIRKNARKKTGGGKKAKQKPLDPQVRDFLILLAIQDAIRKKGTKGRYPMTNAFKRRAKTFSADIAKFMKAL